MSTGVHPLSPRALRIVEAMESINGGADAAERAAAVYEDDAVFVDPLHTCHGKTAIRAMTRRYTERAREIRFEIDRSSVVESDERMSFTWVGVFAGRIGPRVHVEGATHLVLRGDRVAHQRDYFDVLGAVAGALRRLVGSRG